MFHAWFGYKSWSEADWNWCHPSHCSRWPAVVSAAVCSSLQWPSSTSRYHCTLLWKPRNNKLFKLHEFIVFFSLQQVQQLKMHYCYKIWQNHDYREESEKCLYIIQKRAVHFGDRYKFLFLWLSLDCKSCNLTPTPLLCSTCLIVLWPLHFLSVFAISRSSGCPCTELFLNKQCEQAANLHKLFLQTAACGSYQSLH